MNPSTATIDPQLNPREGNPDCGPHSHPPARARQEHSLPKSSTVSSCAFQEQRDALAARPSLHCHSNKTFQSLSPSPNSWRGGGWADQLLLRAPFSPAHPSAPRRALHPSEHILIGRGLRARKLAARLATCIARPSFQLFSAFSSFTLPGWQGGAALYCARPTIYMLLQSSLVSL